MFDLGPHASFILAAYGVTLIAVAGLVLATVGDDLKQRHLLADLERRGIKRRSAAQTKTEPAKPKTARPAAKQTASKPRVRKAPS